MLEEKNEEYAVILKFKTIEEFVEFMKSVKEEYKKDFIRRIQNSRTGLKEHKQ